MGLASHKPRRYLQQPARSSRQNENTLDDPEANEKYFPWNFYWFLFFLFNFTLCSVLSVRWLARRCQWRRRWLWRWWKVMRSLLVIPRNFERRRSDEKFYFSITRWGGRSSSDVNSKKSSFAWRICVWRNLSSADYHMTEGSETKAEITRSFEWSAAQL